MIFHIYQSAIVRNMLGYASAVSVLLFVAILALTARAALDPQGDGPMVERQPRLSQGACSGTRPRPRRRARLAASEWRWWPPLGAPFVWMVSTSFKPSSRRDDARRSNGCPREVTFANYHQGLSNTRS